MQKQAFRAAQLALSCRRPTELLGPASEGETSSIQTGENTSPSPYSIHWAATPTLAPAGHSDISKDTARESQWRREVGESSRGGGTEGEGASHEVGKDDSTRVIEGEQKVHLETDVSGFDSSELGERRAEGRSEGGRGGTDSVAGGGRDGEAERQACLPRDGVDVTAKSQTLPLSPPRTGSLAHPPLLCVCEEPKEQQQGGGAAFAEHCEWVDKPPEQEAAPRAAATAVEESEGGPAASKSGAVTAMARGARVPSAAVGDGAKIGRTITHAADDNAPGALRPDPSDAASSREVQVESSSSAAHMRRPPPIVTKLSPSTNAATSRGKLSLQVPDGSAARAAGAGGADNSGTGMGRDRGSEASEPELRRGCFVAETFSPSDLGLGRSQDGDSSTRSTGHGAGKDGDDDVGASGQRQQKKRSLRRIAGERRSSAEEVRFFTGKSMGEGGGGRGEGSIRRTWV